MIFWKTFQFVPRLYVCKLETISEWGEELTLTPYYPDRTTGMGRKPLKFWWCARNNKSSLFHPLVVTVTISNVFKTFQIAICSVPILESDGSSSIHWVLGFKSRGNVLDESGARNLLVNMQITYHWRIYNFPEGGGGGWGGSTPMVGCQPIILPNFAKHSCWQTNQQDIPIEIMTSFL